MVVTMSIDINGLKPTVIIKLGDILYEYEGRYYKPKVIDERLVLEDVTDSVSEEVKCI